MRLTAALVATLCLVPPVLHAQTLVGTPPTAPSTPPPPAPAPLSAVEQLKKDAAKLEPLVKSEFARQLLHATELLPLPPTRAVWRNKDRSRALTQAQYDALPADEQAAFTKRDCDAMFYYYTGYGTPLMYARAIDLLAQAAPEEWKPENLRSRKILDFGYGTVGHLRLLASLGADVTGIEVEPLFTALYAQPEDQGKVVGRDGVTGNIRLLEGQWPAQAAIVDAVRTAGPYDLIMSKNTLKRGYIHPARETDPSRLVHLGVSDEQFLKTVHDSLKPGGYFLIYNLAPALAPADKPYLPHADGECPFDRALLEKQGFQVIKFDENDQQGIVDFWVALGMDRGAGAEAVKKDLFAWWTLCRKIERRSHTGTKDGVPNITRNFAAEHNARVELIPLKDRAIPVYYEARRSIVDPSDSLNEAGWPTYPDEGHWNDALANLKQNAEALRLIREGASRPHFGVMLSDRLNVDMARHFAEKANKTFEPKTPSENPAIGDLIDDDVQYLRYFTRLLVMDCRRAVAEKDAAGYVANVAALASMSRHAIETPNLLGGYLSMGITSQLLNEVGDVLSLSPSLLNDEQLAAVRKSLEGIDMRTVAETSLKNEQILFEDVSQRTFGDEGGDGAMTEQGWELIARIAGGDAGPASVPSLARNGVCGRAEMVAEFEGMMGELRAYLDKPMWTWEGHPDHIIERRLPTPQQRYRYTHVSLLHVTVGRVILRTTLTEQRLQASIAAIALEQFKRRHGKTAESLAALVPEFIQKVPVDVFDGEPLKYQLADGKPLLYSAGTDRDDDQGRAPASTSRPADTWLSAAELKKRQGRQVPNGDWVLWPQEQNREGR